MENNNNATLSRVFGTIDISTISGTQFNYTVPVSPPSNVNSGNVALYWEAEPE